MATPILPIDSREVRSFLVRQKSLQLATINSDGTPHLATMWFGMIEGTIVFWTQRTSKKAHNLQRDQRLACLFEEGERYSELRGLTINGTAELVEDDDGMLAIGEAIITRNYAENERPDYRAMALSGARIGVRVHSEHVSSWDFERTGRSKPRE